MELCEQRWQEDEFLAKNIKLVYSAIRQMKKDPNDPDILQLGKLAMLQAYRTFDPNRGTKFSTYFYHSIQHFLKPASRADYEIKSKEINNYPFNTGDEVVYGDLDYFVDSSYDIEDSLSKLEAKVLAESILSQLSEEDQYILRDVYYNENSLRSKMIDSANNRLEINLEFVYRRRARHLKSALAKAKEIALA